MTSRILVNSSTNSSKLLLTFVANQMHALEQGRRIKKILDSASSGSDWASVAAELGGGITAQQAQDLWTILSTAMTNIDSAATAELSRLDQG